MYNLLRNKTKKELRKELKPCPINERSYHDIEEIRERIGPVGEDESIRVRLIRTEPVPAYRVTILKRYKTSHKVKMKDGRMATLQPGWYVKNKCQWWVEKVSDGFIWTPALSAERA